MPFRSLRPEERGNALATPLSAAARDFYSEKQSSVYTTAANASIQKDLTGHALELLQLELTHFQVENVFLLDLGAGSGLSTKAAQDWFNERKTAAFTLAFDISASMLSLASKERQEESQVCADFYCGNAAQKLPLREGILDAAIGISMLQWLQPKGLEICFSSLLAQLSSDRDSRAVFQVYPSGLAYVDMMEKTALRVGFNRAETFVSFPHTTTAKKWFFCVEKLTNKHEDNHDEEQELCLFARRYERRCVLQWLGKEKDCAKEIRERVEKEHVKTAWHIWRKYRRSIVDVETEATPAKKPKIVHAKAQQSLELYPSDKVIGRALQAKFEEKAGKITLAFLLEHFTEVVATLHTAYTEARKIELATN
ncbi:methyltransferase WBSCR22 [Phytophthora nicotianae]|uniref:Methyltransferase WBSCR22 n=1 Tax=Phytophthora nicotianae TaxID=4792 RepID=A0A0W8C9Q9_PHYNI|nr:methyltransferase WBSCR22 [Phytophthora nicotianae]